MKDSIGLSTRVVLKSVTCSPVGPQSGETASIEAQMATFPTAVRFDEHTMWVDLTDGRTIGVPLAWFPRLLRAAPAQREMVELSRIGLHWEEIDEDISVAGLLAGRGDQTKQTEHAA